VLRRQIEEQQLKLTQAIKENGRVMEMRWEAINEQGNQSS
jgi:hypothetical protein